MTHPHSRNRNNLCPTTLYRYAMHRKELSEDLYIVATFHMELSLQKGFIGSAYMLAHNDKHNIEGNPLVQYRSLISFHFCDKGILCP